MLKHFISALFLFGIFNISYGDVQTDFVAKILDAKIGETCFLDEDACSSTVKVVGILTIEDYIDSNLPISSINYSIINTANQANFAVNMSFYNGQLHNHSSQISEFFGFL